MKLKRFQSTSLAFLLILTLTHCAQDQEQSPDKQDSTVIATDTEQAGAEKPEQSSNEQTANLVVKDVSLDSADSAIGKRLFIQCQACHTINKGGSHLIGPNLWGLVDRAAGKQEGFKYSDGLANADFNWTLGKLDQFLEKPNDVIPGTTMIFVGVTDEKARLNLLAYLQEAATIN